MYGYGYNSSTLQPNLPPLAPRSPRAPRTSGAMDIVGTNGLQTGLTRHSACWPTPSTGNDTVDKLKVWLDKPVMESHPTILNKHAAMVGGLVAAVGVYLYGSEKRWF
jgi:hypothetical protein